MPRRKTRPLFDGYTQDFISEESYVSRIPGIQRPPETFFRHCERGSGTYHLCESQPDLYNLARLADGCFGSLPVGTGLSLAEGLQLMDWLVSHDWLVRQALLHFVEEPDRIVDIIERAWRELYPDA